MHFIMTYISRQVSNYDFAKQQHRLVQIKANQYGKEHFNSINGAIVPNFKKEINMLYQTIEVLH